MQLSLIGQSNRINEKLRSRTVAWLGILERRPLTPMIKLFAKQVAIKCPQCQISPIDAILAEWKGAVIPKCWRCELVRMVTRVFLQKIVSLPMSKLHNFASTPMYTRLVKAAIQGLAVFGLKRPQPTFPPLAVVWNVTNHCNLKCPHCYQDSNYSIKAHEQSGELTTSEALQAIDLIAEAGCASLSFSGGEPLLRPDFYDLARRASQHRLFCTLSTNGTQIDHTVADELANVGVEGVAISLDSRNSTFHDEFRGVPGAHAAALKALEICAENGRFKGLIVAMTLTNRNINDIPALLELAGEIGATRFYVSRILPVGRGKTLRHLDVTPEQRREVLETMAENFVSYARTGRGVPPMARGMTYFAPQCAILSDYEIFPISEIMVGFSKHHEERLGRSARYFFRQLAEYAGGCATGLTYCGLSPEGNILPCAPATHVPLGNILTDGLQKVWLNHPFLRTLRNRTKLEGKCSTCRNTSICGGCRVTAYGETGNWLASDPSCPY